MLHCFLLCFANSVLSRTSNFIYMHKRMEFENACSHCLHLMHGMSELFVLFIHEIDSVANKEDLNLQDFFNSN